jgi:hypothetical protein
MPRTTPFAALLAAVLAALLLGGCTTTVSGTPAADPAPAPTEGPGSDPVAWADRFCGALLTFVRPILVQPDFTAAPDLASIQQVFSSYLGSVVAGTQQSRSELAAIGRAPVAGGDEVITRFDGVLRRLELDFSAAKARVDGADPNNPEAFLAALEEVEAMIGAINAPDALSDLADVPRLSQAAERSANCQELQTLELSSG